jgi:peptidoglycan/xylan/chitin deacetylase (PgdA/CDA1 family)
MKIVFSYDCEGNWGFVDWRVSPLAKFDPMALETVYRMLTDTHQKYDVPACFAFVGLYSLPRRERQVWVQENLADLVEKLPNLAAENGFWEGENNIDYVAKAARDHGVIDIGSHGLTHRPIAGLDAGSQRMEFDHSADILARTTGTRPKAFIYPRNLVAATVSCLNTYDAYRDTEAVAPMQRAIDLNRAIMGFDVPLSSVTSDFIFWKGGHRRHFTDRGWRRLWRARVADAKAGRNANRLIHVWSHPHNFLTDPDLTERFHWLMELLSANSDAFEFCHLKDITVPMRSA